MTLRALCICLSLAGTALPLQAQTVDHVEIRERSLNVIEQQFDAFRTATGALSVASTDYCENTLGREAYLAAFTKAWLAWVPLEAYQFGPIEQTSAALTVEFWPDKKNFVKRGLRGLLGRSASEQADPVAVAQGSAAAQGLPAIEMLMFTDMPECPALIGLSGNIDRVAHEIYEGWFATDGWADLARAAGPDNPVYLTDAEFTKTLYTAMDFALTRIADTRLGRPLGTYEQSFPKRTEAWRSGLSLAIIEAQLDGVAQLLDQGFGPSIHNPSLEWVLSVIGDTEKRIDAIDLPLHTAVDNPMSRIRVEALQTKVLDLQQQFAEDIGPELGVETGFSPADGD